MQNSQKEEQNRQATIQVKIMEGRFHYLRDLYLDAADAALVNKEVKNLIAALQEEDPKAVFDYIASLQKGSFKKTEPLFVAKLTEIYRTLVKMKKVKEQDKQEKKEELKGLMGQLSNIKSSGFSEEEQENLKRWYEGEFMRVLQSRPDMADDFSNVLEEKSPVGDNMQERVRKEFLSKTEREWVQNALRGLVSNKGLIFAGASAEDKDLIKATIPLRSFLMQHLEAAGSYIQHLLSKSDPTNAAALEWLYANMCWVQGEVQALRAACAALEAKKASAADQNVIDGLHVQVGEQAMHLIRLCVSSPEAELYIRATLENISPEQAIFKKALTEVGDKLQHIRPINTLIEEVTTLKSKFTAIFKADSEEALNAVSSEVMDIPQENPDMKEEELAPLEKERQKKLAALTHRKDIASKELADLLHSQPDIVDYLLEPNASHEVVLDVSLSQKERQRIDAQLRALHILGSTQEVQEGVVSEEVSSDLRNYLVQNAERAMPYMWKLEQRYKSSALTQLCQKVDETLNKSEAALTSLSQLPYSTKRASLSASVAGSKMFAMSWPTPDQKHGPEDYYKIFKKDSGGNRQYCFTSAFRVHGEVVSCSEDDPQNYEELESVLIQALEKGRNPLSNAQKEKVRLFLSGFMQKLSYIGKKPITDRKIIGQEKQSDARKQDFMRYILKQIAQGDWTAVVKQDCY